MNSLPNQRDDKLGPFRSIIGFSNTEEGDTLAMRRSNLSSTRTGNNTSKDTPRLMVLGGLIDTRKPVSIHSNNANLASRSNMWVLSVLTVS